MRPGLVLGRDDPMIKHIVASGCSQTADGIGGAPWTPFSHGGCSFVDRGDGTRADPASWVSFVAQQMQVKSLTNLAAESHGNQYVGHTIMDFLSRRPYPQSETLVLFNVTEPLRIDTPCSFDHPDRCAWVPYSADVLPYSWLSNRSRLQDSFRKNIGFEQLGQISRLALISLISFLQHRQYRYLFVTMADYTQDRYIGDVMIGDANRIVLDPGPGMIELGRDLDLMKDDVHPTRQGQEIVAQQVIEVIRSRGW